MRCFFERTVGTVYGRTIRYGPVEQVFEYDSTDSADRIYVCKDSPYFLLCGSDFDLDICSDVFEKYWKTLRGK